MKNRQLSTLLQGALSLQDIKGVKFAYALKRNINRLKSEIGAIYHILDASGDYKKFDIERIALAESMAEKDKDGKAIVEERDGTEHFKIKDKKKFNTALKKLQKKHEKAIKGFEDQHKLFQEKLEEESTIKFYKITEMPTDVSMKQMDIIYSFMMDRPQSEIDDEAEDTKSAPKEDAKKVQ